MKKLTRLALPLLLLLALASCATGTGGGEKISILYAGNSFVYTGNVPKQVRILAGMYGVAAGPGRMGICSA